MVVIGAESMWFLKVLLSTSQDFEEKPGWWDYALMVMWMRCALMAIEARRRWKLVKQDRVFPYQARWNQHRRHCRQPDTVVREHCSEALYFPPRCWGF